MNRVAFPREHPVSVAGPRIVTCSLEDLCPHPSYERHGLSVSAMQLAALARLGEAAFHDPLVITRERTLIDGYGRWELAKQRGRHQVICIEYDLTKAEALRWLIQAHLSSRGLNAFSRVMLALDLEDSLGAEARQHQQHGGHEKGSSKLTDADRLDVRSEIAAVAGVSVGNVTKVKQLTRKVLPEVLQALYSGEIRIHRAWMWSQEPLEKQRKLLLEHRSGRGINRAIHRLISGHRMQESIVAADIPDLLPAVSELQSRNPSLISMVVVKIPGNKVFLTADLLATLRSVREEQTLKCVRNDLQESSN